MAVYLGLHWPICRQPIYSHRSGAHNARSAESGLAKSSAKTIPENSVIVSTRATIGRIAINRIPLATNQGFKNIIIKDYSRVIPEYLALSIRKLVPLMETWATGGTFKEISKTKFCELQIPLPPFEVQQEIVTEIEGYQRVIDGARAIVENYRSSVPVDSAWPLVPLGSVCEINPPKSNTRHLPPSTLVSFVPMSTLNEYQMTFVATEERSIGEVGTSYTYFSDDDVLIAKVTPCFENGKAAVARGLTNGVGFGSSEYHVLRCNDQILPEIVYHFLMNPQFREPAILNMTGTGGLQRIPRDFVANFHIPIPPMDAQLDIVAEIQAEQALVEGNRGLIQRMESKVEAAIARVWT